MGRLKEYSQDYRRKIICMYQESGLTTYRFCQLPDVSVSVATVKRWLRIHQESRTLVNKAAKTPSPHVDLNIACYSLSNDVEKLVNEEQEKAVTLEEMIKFQRDVHDCCLHLYQMRCSKKNISLLSQILEVL
jgi:transposase